MAGMGTEDKLQKRKAVRCSMRLILMVTIMSHPTSS